MPSASPIRRPSLGTMLWRAVRRRCAWCAGRGAFFDGWFAKAPACHGCGLRWRRGDVGFELGAAAIAAIIVMGPLMLILGVVMLATWPELNAVPMLIGLGGGAIVLPIVLYPMSYTLWQALDIAMRPPQADDFELPSLVFDE